MSAKVSDRSITVSPLIGTITVIDVTPSGKVRVPETAV